MCQVRERHYAAQVARREETLATLSARDKDSFVRPKGYKANRDFVGSKASAFM